MKKALEAIIQRMEDPPPSMHEVARRLKYPRETLYERFPEYCRTIGQRYRKYRPEQRKKYVQGKCEEVRDAAYNLYAQGYFPKESDVKKMITTPGVFKMPEVQEEWKISYSILEERHDGELLFSVSSTRAIVCP